MIEIKIKVKSDAKLPEYKSEGSVGMDLYAYNDYEEINPGEIKLIDTGLFIEIPEGYEAQVRPRSGLALNHGITVLNTPGTIDWDYRGEIKVILINLGRQKFIVRKNDRIAQMVVMKTERAVWKSVDELNETKRSSGGFGHTGI